MNKPGCSILRPCILPVCENQKFELVHKFPSDNSKAQKWFEAITLNGNNPIAKLDGFTLDEIKKKFFICSRHFKSQDYKNEISRSLNITAIPSINLTKLDEIHLMRDVTEVTVIETIDPSQSKFTNLNASIKPVTSHVYSIKTEPFSPAQKIKVTSVAQQKTPIAATPKVIPVISKIHSANVTILNKQPNKPVQTNKGVVGGKVQKESPSVKRKISTEIVIEEIPKSPPEKPKPVVLQPKSSPTQQQRKRQKIDPSIIESESPRIIPAAEDEKPNSTNKLMALFEVTREQYEILNRKLLSGESTDFLNLKDEKIEDMAENLTEIVIDGDKKLEFDPFWLRDHCKCDVCYNHTTFQRKLKATDIPETIAVKSYQLTNGDVNVTWNDGHQSKYSLEFLQKYTFENLIETGDPEKRLLWTASDIEGKPARIDYRDYLVDDEAGKEVVKSLINYGVAFVEKVPANAQQTEFVIRKLFPIHKTLFGEMWTFSDSMDHRDTAYTKEFLGPHHDNTYFNDASGLQILHCIFHEGTEGETFLVDGFKVCEKIRADHPDVFKRLCNTLVPAEYIEEGKHHKFAAPIIQVDPITDQLQQIRYNLYDRAPFDTLPQNKVRQFYRDLKILSREMDNKENQWWFKLNPGTVMIFDNWRVLHARNHYTGKRTMTGCYVSRTEFLSVARTMNFIR